MYVPSKIQLLGDGVELISSDGVGIGYFFFLKALMHKAFVEKEITNTYTIGGYQFNSVTQQLDFAGNIQELSHRESEILKRLCENRNEVVNSQSILLELWGDDSFFNSRSLHVFITKLRHKLSKDQSIRIVNVRGIGYKLIIN